MDNQTKVTGVILAGGRGRRMEHKDKGLVLFRGRPLVSYAIEAVAEVADQTIISANRNLDRYREFGLPVVTDLNGAFDGPLAGILSAMTYVDGDVLLVMPCDSPLFRAEHLKLLLTAREAGDADAAVAYDGVRLHPVIMAIKTSTRPSLEAYLASGQRKMEYWLEQLRTVRVDFSRWPDLFANVNTLAELEALEKSRNEQV